MRIALAQINPIVGDLAGNVASMVRAARRAEGARAALVVFPELCLTGYPPLDLLEQPSFLDAVERSVAELCEVLPPGLGVLLGAPVRNRASRGKPLQNAALLIHEGAVVGTVFKRLLPTYDVFDEYRYFEPAPRQPLLTFQGTRLGVHICEDMWNTDPDVSRHLYEGDPIEDLVADGAELLINLSASPYAMARTPYRRQLAGRIAARTRRPLVLVNQVGAQTDILFDGDSRVYDDMGRLVCVCRSFEEDLQVCDLSDMTPMDSPGGSRIADLHDALVMGIRDYVGKTGAFSGAIVGLSGGIDSAVTAALAVAALGPDRVEGVALPSKFSSEGSITDAIALARALGIRCDELSIGPAVDAVEHTLQGRFAGTASGLAEENVQARMRGLLLMALSNKFGRLVLTTGNKSEMAVGYCTLYGDMNGGLAVLADVYKMDVYALAEYINAQAGHAVIPISTITKPPSAELRPDQKDEDSLPPYAVLDDILLRYIEKQQEAPQIAKETGYDVDLVIGMLNMVDRNEYKRRQAAPGLRVSTKAFGTGRRIPIVMKWHRDRPS